MIDREKFKETFKHYDNEVIVQIMDIFLGEYDNRLKELQKYIIELDFDALNHKAHSLKGALAYLSTELEELSSILEVKGRQKNGDGLQPVFDQLNEGVLKLVEDLKEIRKEYLE